MCTFIGLNLNLMKTIAFMPKAETLKYYLDVEIAAKPIKYLGAQLGLGDLSLSNFQKPLKNAWNKLSAWNKRWLTIFAWILIAKVLVLVSSFMSSTVHLYI